MLVIVCIALNPTYHSAIHSPSGSRSDSPSEVLGESACGWENSSANEYPCELPTELRTNTLTEVPGDRANEPAYDPRVESAIESVDESLDDAPIDSPTELSGELPSELPSADVSFAGRDVQWRFSRCDRRCFRRGLGGSDTRSDGLNFGSCSAESDAQSFDGSIQVSLRVSPRMSPRIRDLWNSAASLPGSAPSSSGTSSRFAFGGFRPAEGLQLGAEDLTFPPSAWTCASGCGRYTCSASGAAGGPGRAAGTATELEGATVPGQMTQSAE